MRQAKRTAMSSETTRSFAFAGLARPPEAGKPRAACESPRPLQFATADGGWKGGQARHRDGGPGFGGIPPKIPRPAAQDCGELHHPGTAEGRQNGHEHLPQDRGSEGKFP
jgi:hypothetical protein